MEIFLSHASESKQLVRQFCAHLPHHINIWLDQDALDLGVRFPEKLETAIKEEVEFFILFYDNPAVDSDWVAQEINWALEREKELNRSFILPIILQRESEAAYKANPLGDKLYLNCFDHSDEGIEHSAKKLADYLFALVSRQFGNMETGGTKKVLEALSYDLTRFKELAYALQAALGDSIALIASSEDSTAHLVQAITNYNEFTNEMMLRLTTHISNVKQRFGNNLAEQCSELLQYLEKKVYRGQIFALNKIRDYVNNYQLVKGEVDSNQLSDWDKDKAQLLKDCLVVMDKLTENSTALVQALEKEL